MTAWPKDGSPLSFEKLTAPLRSAIKFAYKLERQNREKDIPWRGPTVGASSLAHGPDPQKQLKATNLQYSEEDQGRDALEEIIGLALRLGIEQGRRITMTGDEVKTLETYAKLGEILSRDVLDIRPMKDAPRDGTPINIRLRFGPTAPSITAMRWKDGKWGERWYAASDYADNHISETINDLPPEEADWSPITFFD